MIKKVEHGLVKVDAEEKKLREVFFATGLWILNKENLPYTCATELRERGYKIEIVEIKESKFSFLLLQKRFPEGHTVKELFDDLDEFLIEVREIVIDIHREKKDKIIKILKKESPDELTEGGIDKVIEIYDDIIPEGILPKIAKGFHKYFEDKSDKEEKDCFERLLTKKKLTIADIRKCFEKKQKNIEYSLMLYYNIERLVPIVVAKRHDVHLIDQVLKLDEKEYTQIKFMRNVYRFSMQPNFAIVEGSHVDITFIFLMISTYLRFILETFCDLIDGYSSNLQGINLLQATNFILEKSDLKKAKEVINTFEIILVTIRNSLDNIEQQMEEMIYNPPYYKLPLKKTIRGRQYKVEPNKIKDLDEKIREECKIPRLAELVKKKTQRTHKFLKEVRSKNEYILSQLREANTTEIEKTVRLSLSPALEITKRRKRKKP